MDLLDGVREAAFAADESGRKSIINELNQLVRELQTPQENVLRLFLQVSSFPSERNLERRLVIRIDTVLIRIQAHVTARDTNWLRPGYLQGNC